MLVNKFTSNYPLHSTSQSSLYYFILLLIPVSYKNNTTSAPTFHIFIMPTRITFTLATNITLKHETMYFSNCISWQIDNQIVFLKTFSSKELKLHSLQYCSKLSSNAYYCVKLFLCAHSPLLTFLTWFKLTAVSFNV